MSRACGILNRQSRMLILQVEGVIVKELWQQRTFDKLVKIEACHTGVGVGSGLGSSFYQHAVSTQAGQIYVQRHIGGELF